MMERFPNRKWRFKSIWRMPRLKTAMKDAVWRRYAPGRCQATFDPEISEWGNPAVQTTACRALHRSQNIADLTQTVAEGIRMNFFCGVPRSFRVRPRPVQSMAAYPGK